MYNELFKKLKMSTWGFFKFILILVCTTIQREIMSGPKKERDCISALMLEEAEMVWKKLKLSTEVRHLKIYLIRELCLSCWHRFNIISCTGHKVHLREASWGGRSTHISLHAWKLVMLLKKENLLVRDFLYTRESCYSPVTAWNPLFYFYINAKTHL